MTTQTLSQNNHSAQVLIVGAGPTGMVLALWLTKQGTPVRIIDKNNRTGIHSRATVVHARTLELYRQMGIADQVVADGFRIKGVNFWSQGKHQSHFLMGEINDQQTPYPFILIYPQDKHEKLLEQTLANYDITVERNTELVNFIDNGDYVTSTLLHSNGQKEIVTTRFLAGCDGARSVVRKALKADFDGGTYHQLFYVADVELEDDRLEGQLHIAFQDSDLLLVMPYEENGKKRLVGTITPEKVNKPAETISFEDINHRSLNSLNLQVKIVNWFSTYHVHHRVTKNFRYGQIFLLGDAAHIHSPVGGQGMNTGIGDAINLAWKLTSVLENQAPITILDSINSERATFANELVNTTDKVFDFVTKDGQFASFIRTYIAPNLIKTLWQFDFPKEKLFKAVSQIKLHYRASELSEGSAGKVYGGDRLPYVKVGDTDNFANFDGITWQVQVYGEKISELQAWCNEQKIKLLEFAWQDSFRQAGFIKDSVFLIRPDSYIAIAVTDNAKSKLENYMLSKGLKFN